MSKIAIVGSRKFKDKKFVKDTVGKYFDIEYTFISGGAHGVDSWAEETIDEMNKIINPVYLIKKNIYLPNWNKYGKRAGFIRNELIVNEADKVVAFWDGISKGTKHSINLAIKAGKPIDIYIRQQSQEPSIEVNIDEILRGI